MRAGRPARHAPARIRAAQPDDVPFLVSEHLEHFPEGFFARLGPRFLAELVRAHLSSPYARVYVAVRHGEPVGFLVGVTRTAEHRRHTLRAHGRRLLLLGVACLAVRPRLAAHFLRTRFVRYSRKLLLRRAPAPQAAGPAGGVTAVLAHIAVVRHARSYGIGEALINQFLDDSADAGCARVSLVTAADENGAGGYYEQRDWLPRGETRTAEGRVFVTYERTLAGRPTTPRH